MAMHVPPLQGGDGMLYAYQVLTKAFQKASQAASGVKEVVAEEVGEYFRKNVSLQERDKVGLTVPKQGK